MVPINSEVENKIYPLYVLEERLKPEGFVIGSNWDYDKGYFDMKIDDDGIYYFLRIPFYAVAGSLDYPGVTVRVDQPFLLAHQYQRGFDEEGAGGALRGAFDQFQTPVNADADVPDDYVATGKEIMKKVERLLLPGS
ncbi:YugN-like family protein [Virgibacillus salinus]|uniref:YugN-like family protein n=1 Tax=Virgibacillus salinus TaxID=553311 RepID=A0A1H0ZPK8_9BACI|nr:YugN-like family protein [Virgibacillus salinus]SDQ29322.1 YugN-like family protein [Virgibacillus salinus]